MTDFQDTLIKLNKNLNILREREAKYAGQPPLELLNQIEDHEQAISLTEQAIAGDIVEAEWRAEMKPLLVAINQRTGEAAVSITIGDIGGDISGSIIAGGDVRDNVMIDQQVEAQYNVAGNLIINYPPPPPSVTTEADVPAAGDEPLPDCPYRGLFAFRPEHAPLFFGRDTFTKGLVRAVESRSLTAVLGASGSGKSSVVFAGLVPALDVSGPWLFTTFRPGNDPFLGLANALVPLYETDLSKTKQLVAARELATGLKEGKLPLSDVLNLIHQSRFDHRLLVIADQFEELYTLCRDTEVRQQFLDVLLEAVRTIQEPSARLVLTLRADFLSQASLYRPLADALQGATELIGSMTREELTEVVEKPAELQGVQFEEKLVDRILDDVGEQEGGLPLLEFALTELWQHQRQRTLTHIAYEEIGQAKGALSAHADQVYQRLTPAEQEQARRIFVQLVSPGAGTEDTRRLATRVELEKDWSLITKLAGERLVVTNQAENELDTVEVVHEALISHWTQLRAWIEKDREFHTWRQEFRADLKRWQEMSQDKGALLRGAPLAVAAEMLAEHLTDLTETEQQFIKASLEQQRRQEQQRRLIFAGAIVVAIIMASLAIFALNRSQVARQALDTAIANESTAVAAQATAVTDREEAERLRRISLAQSLAALAPRIVERNNDTELAALLSLEAEYLNRDLGAHIQGLVDSSLRDVLSEPYFHTVLRGHVQSVTTVAFSPDGATLASSGWDGIIYLWDLTDPGAAPVMLNRKLDIVNMVLSGETLPSIDTVAFSPDGTTLLSHKWSTIKLWDLTDPNAPPTELSDLGGVEAVAFSPDGTTLALGYPTIHLRDLTDPDAEPVLLSGHEGSVYAVAFSPDGATLASGSGDDTIRLWDLTDPEITPVVLSGHESGIRAVAFSPDGATLASGSLDGTIRLWDVTNPEIEPVVLSGHESGIRAVAFSPDGQTLASSSFDEETIRLWDVTDLEADPVVLSGHQIGVNAVAFSPDTPDTPEGTGGTILASAGSDGTVRLWDLTGPETEPVVLSDHHQGVVRAVAFSPDTPEGTGGTDGLTLASGSWDDTIRLWDLTDPGAAPVVFSDQEEWVSAVAFSPDGASLASANGDANRIVGVDTPIRLWDLTNPEADPIVFSDSESGVLAVAFSPDSKVLASGDVDNTVRLWDVTDPEAAPIVLNGHQGYVSAVAFSPDTPEGSAQSPRGTGDPILASGSADGTIRLWDVTDLEADPVVLSGHQAVVFAVAFSPDGTTLASGSQDGTIRLWDVTDPGATSIILSGRQAFTFLSVAFSPDGQTLASGSGDGAVRLWDVTSPGTPPVVLSGHHGYVNTVAFSPDGTILASGSQDNTIRLWIARTDILVDLACQKVRRNLTRTEWDRYLPGEDYRQTCPNLSPGK